MPPTDEDAALHAIAALDQPSPAQLNAQRAIAAILHNGEPFVDLHTLFALYDILYFRNLLLSRVEVLWSSRLTLCAGICELSKDPQTGHWSRIRLKLSSPLLQYRPRSDTINTLLHEAIHAYFFITTSWTHSRGDDGTGHGRGFQLLADALNNHGDYQITVYHSFHDEVDSYRTHVWKCNGPCQTQPPYFGLVKRSMNRAPGKSDSWWVKHQAECGGTYTKIREPAPTKKQLQAMTTKERAGRQKNKLNNWITAGPAKQAQTKGSTSDDPIHLPNDKPPAAPSHTSKPKDLVVENLVSSPSRYTSPHAGHKRPPSVQEHDTAMHKKLLIQCPICNLTMAEADINQHLDVAHC
ncbi:hypothetical protein COCMIDRAFT_3517 [Bipolaris oryzae ATCC 44560]|uniref:Protein with SprT-like domain at the N terminus n=1 Tax=Bipolaris oryzae ATCC 44560 TaxID=930090 RepID=W6ZUR7_COCMI|nr:uncharacterized protein COCMIDRAFT_3517 [Bipolaris oryzae ATCC 44560]EUC47571.1 hypothetical protein COCMIDRAFT_3517 [Bipolaris oryzae ATCC 44560]